MALSTRVPISPSSVSPPQKALAAAGYFSIRGPSNVRGSPIGAGFIKYGGYAGRIGDAARPSNCHPNSAPRRRGVRIGLGSTPPSMALPYGPWAPCSQASNPLPITPSTGATLGIAFSAQGLTQPVMSSHHSGASGPVRPEGIGTSSAGSGRFSLLSRSLSISPISS